MKRVVIVMVFALTVGFGVGSLSTTRAGYTSMTCGGYWAYGESYKSPNAQAGTAAHIYCAKYFTTSATINGSVYSYGGGWDPPHYAYPIDWTSSIFSTHNACYTTSCNGYVGTSDY